MDTPSTRAIAAIGKQAWFALMNRKSRTAACRSPEQTRPRLLKEYRAPAAAACSHAAAGSTHHARMRSDQEPPPPAALVSVSLGDPRANGVAAWLKLAGKIVRITSSTDEVDHLPAKLRRIRWTCSWHRQHLWRETRGVHQTGSIPLGRFWKRADVEVEGCDPRLQQVIRWNLFQLLQATERAEGHGARGPRPDRPHL